MTRDEAVGKKFNRLLVTAWKRVGRSTVGVCVCDCGTTKEIALWGVVHGSTKSCGCYNKEVAAQRSITHGGSSTKTYRIWMGMKGRCRNPNNPKYRIYGGRGITVCERWNDFANFIADLGECPPGYSIERIDVNGNYEPSNCKWIPMLEQGKNQRRTNRIILDGVEKTIHEWCAIKGFEPHFIHNRLQMGWPAERLFDPVNTKLDPNQRAARKLDWDTADEIRRLHASGLKQTEIAKQYEITQAMVSAIVLKKSWVRSQPTAAPESQPQCPSELRQEHKTPSRLTAPNTQCELAFQDS